MSYDGNRPAKWSDGPWIPRPIRHKHTKLKIEALRLEAKIIAQGQLGEDSRQRLQMLTYAQMKPLRVRG